MLRRQLFHSFDRCPGRRNGDDPGPNTLRLKLSAERQCGGPALEVAIVAAVPVGLLFAESCEPAAVDDALLEITFASSALRAERPSSAFRAECFVTAALGLLVLRRRLRCGRLA